MKRDILHEACSLWVCLVWSCFPFCGDFERKPKCGLGGKGGGGPPKSHTIPFAKHPCMCVCVCACVFLYMLFCLFVYLLIYLFVYLFVFIYLCIYVIVLVYSSYLFICVCVWYFTADKIHRIHPPTPNNKALFGSSCLESWGCLGR